MSSVSEKLVISKNCILIYYLMKWVQAMLSSGFNIYETENTASLNKNHNQRQKQY